jgi:hypothetical protein
MREFVGDNVLSGAAAAQVDPTKYGWLAALGINSQQAASENAAALANQEINAVRAAWRANPNINTAQSQAALALGFSLPDIRNIAGAKGSVLGQDEFNAQDTSGLGFSGDTAHNWILLGQALDKAQMTVQSALIDGLEPLTPQLASLSKAAADTIASLLTSKTLKDDLNEFVGWLESAKFKQDVADFITSFDVLASKMKGFLQSMGVWPSTNSGPGSNSTSSNSSSTPTPAGWSYPGFSLPSDPDSAVTPASARWKLGSYGMDFSAVEKKNNLPPGTLMALAKVESSMDPNAVGPKTKYGQAQGLFQLMPRVSWSCPTPWCRSCG